MNTVVKKEKKLIDYLENIKKDHASVNKLIEDSERKIRPAVFEKLDFKFFEKYIENYKLSKPKLNIDLQNEHNYTFDGDKNLLEILLDELLENACKHGFGYKYKKNKILVEIESIITSDIDSYEFDVSEGHEYIKISVSNTGIPFDESITKELYTRRHWSSKKDSSGLGGSDIANLIKMHNHGSLAMRFLRHSEESDFSTTIECLIPKINEDYV